MAFLFACALAGPCSSARAACGPHALGADARGAAHFEYARLLFSGDATDPRADPSPAPCPRLSRPAGHDAASLPTAPPAPIRPELATAEDDPGSADRRIGRFAIEPDSRALPDEFASRLDRPPRPGNPG